MFYTAITPHSQLHLLNIYFNKLKNNCEFFFYSTLQGSCFDLYILTYGARIAPFNLVKLLQLKSNIQFLTEIWKIHPAGPDFFEQVTNLNIDLNLPKYKYWNKKTKKQIQLAAKNLHFKISDVIL